MSARVQCAIGIIFTGVCTCAHAQWANYRTPGIPRLADGKPNLTAPAPRTSYGRPDLSGVWQTEPSAPGDLERLLGAGAADFSAFVVPGDDPRIFNKYFFNIFADFKPREAPVKPEVEQQALQRMQAESGGTEIHCLPMGVPRVLFVSVPFKIVQTPQLILMIYEADYTRRQVYLDGRKLPADPDPTWLGYSTGRWDANTLVVDTAGLNDKAFLDAMSHPRSESMHITERFRRRDFGHMEVEMSFNDPVNYTKPFSIHFNLELHPDTDVLETICNEGEKDLAHMAKH